MNPARFEPVALHSLPTCTCDDQGESPDCIHHGYEAVIKRLRIENDRMRNALEAIQEVLGV